MAESRELRTESTRLVAESLAATGTAEKKRLAQGALDLAQLAERQDRQATKPR